MQTYSQRQALKYRCPYIYEVWIVFYSLDSVTFLPRLLRFLPSGYGFSCYWPASFCWANLSISGSVPNCPLHAKLGCIQQVVWSGVTSMTDASQQHNGPPTASRDACSVPTNSGQLAGWWSASHHFADPQFKVVRLKRLQLKYFH